MIWVPPLSSSLLPGATAVIAVCGVTNDFLLAVLVISPSASGCPRRQPATPRHNRWSWWRSAAIPWPEPVGHDKLDDALATRGLLCQVAFAESPWWPRRKRFNEPEKTTCCWRSAPRSRYKLTVTSNVEGLIPAGPASPHAGRPRRPALRLAAFRLYTEEARPEVHTCIGAAMKE